MEEADGEFEEARSRARNSAQSSWPFCLRAGVRNGLVGRTSPVQPAGDLPSYHVTISQGSAWPRTRPAGVEHGVGAGRRVPMAIPCSARANCWAAGASACWTAGPCRKSPRCTARLVALATGPQHLRFSRLVYSLPAECSSSATVSRVDDGFVQPRPNPPRTSANPVPFVPNPSHMEPTS